MPWPSAIVAMAGSLGLRTVAEEVEHTAQQERLQALGCDEVQGFLFSRPLRAADFGALLERRERDSRQAATS